MADPLAVAEIIIYIILLQPTFVILWKHGRHGILGWSCVQLFCLLRIVGNVVILHEDAIHATDSKALLIGSIGLSPLLLATAGILHEARSARNPELRQRTEWFIVIQYHMLVSTALALIVVGVVHLMGNNAGSTTKVLMRVGAALVVVCWVLLLPWTAHSLLSYQREGNAIAHAGGTKLLYAVTLAIPFIGIRLAYAVASLLIELTDRNSEFTKSLAIKVCLSVLPEIVVTIVYIVTGIATRNLPWASGRWKKTKTRSGMNFVPGDTEEVALATVGNPRYDK